jgi:hypothetical protein
MTSAGGGMTAARRLFTSVFAFRRDEAPRDPRGLFIGRLADRLIHDGGGPLHLIGSVAEC